ncbi:MAG: type II secretion system F family protein [Actinomycetaceae bacterium]|nr:type II secretion system F family protein [Actinomycetaceae bacterium]
MGFCVGAGIGLGLWLVLRSLLPARPRVVERVLPYLDDGWRGERAGWRLRLATGFMRVLDRIGSSTSSVRRRVNSLGTLTVEQFRLRQLKWTVSGLAFGLFVALVLVARGVSVPFGVVMACGGGIGGALGADSWLSRQTRGHCARLTRELPDVAELLALAVGAGESILAGLERVQGLGHGALTWEIERTLRDVRAGAPLVEALRAMSQRSESPSVSRFSDALVTSIERGTSLSVVLRAQAADAREYGRRQLLEEGGRREIAMMVPVVFLILPVTVLFALYPALCSIISLE